MMSSLCVGAIIKTTLACVVAYLLGVALSPHVIPVDYFRQSGGSSTLAVLVGGNDTVPRRPDVESASSSSSVPEGPPSPVIPPRGRNPLEQSYASLLDLDSNGGVDPFADVDIFVHRNGEAYPCSRQGSPPPDDDGEGGAALSWTSRALLDSAIVLPSTVGDITLKSQDKYAFDAILTSALMGGGMSIPPLLHDGGEACGPTWKNHILDSIPALASISSLLKYCDMGIDRTTVQLDHDRIVNVPKTGTKPCHFHTREGLRITGLRHLAQLAKDAGVVAAGKEECALGVDGTCEDDDANTSTTRRKELHLYAVQAGRQFIFAPKYVGEIFDLPHVPVPLDLPVRLEVISLVPRVFDVYNFFNREESAAIVDKALKETSESHKMKRSSTGANGYNINSQRTSENGFDTHSDVAQAVKRRCMTVLGFDEYEESLTDGLQILRYNKTTAYVPHLDWIDDYGKQNEHDCEYASCDCIPLLLMMLISVIVTTTTVDTEHLGTNRFATILLYMTDMKEGDGGETVFTEGYPPGDGIRLEFEEAQVALRKSGDTAGILEENSWEENMVVRCRSRLSIRPHSSRAVLFYSQNPDGTPDQKSMHGGCPVIRGEKWAANLWVWNGPRNGYPGSPTNQDVVERNRAAGKQNTQQKQTSFLNTQTDETMRNAQLYFQDTFWGKMGFGDPAINVNTYKGHQWHVKVNEMTVKTFIIDDSPNQSYTI
ncbi:hypothetical protein ACHAXA_004233 [Cyclostephanos tholiformis]|uniref:Fe2OG dioxygenase domain-containing protein n=1 Tax=Cyclostephanos tholiformis TaxID=382380 RepID=A0ABD3R9H9_9STRA